MKQIIHTTKISNHHIY